MNIALIITVSILLIASVVVFLTGEANNFSVKRFKYLIMALLLGLGFSLFWLIPSFTDISVSLTYRIIQVLVLIFGIWAVKFGFRSRFENFQRLTLSTLSIAGIAISSAWLFGAVFMQVFTDLDLSFFAGTSYVVGFFPVLFVLGFENQLEIPEPYFKFFEWPDGTNPIDRDYVDMDNVAIISIEYTYSEEDREYTEVQFKAPFDYLLKDYFYDFVIEMNDNDHEIAYTDSEGDFYKWLFYVKPRKFWESKRFLDPDKSLIDNNIQEYCTIVFERFKEEI